MSFPPAAYIIGAQKAGTTSLAHLLDQHPELALARSKETDFFTRNWHRGLDWYRAQFDGLEARVLIDASASYSSAPIDDVGSQDGPTAGVPARIHSVQPHARFIYVLRDPAARAYSSYWHNVRVGLENRSFRDALAAQPGYIRASRYYCQIANYLEYFPLESFLFVDFRNLQNDAAAVAARCSAFLGVADTHTFVFDRPKNRSFRYNAVGNLLRTVVGSSRGLKSLSRFARRALPRPLYVTLTRAIARKIPAMSAADRAYLEDLFRDDNEKLAQLTGISFV